MLPEVIISEHSSSSLHKRRLKFSHAKKKPHVNMLLRHHLLRAQDHFKRTGAKQKAVVRKIKLNPASSKLKRRGGILLLITAQFKSLYFYGLW